MSFVLSAESIPGEATWVEASGGAKTIAGVSLTTWVGQTIIPTDEWFVVVTDLPDMVESSIIFVSIAGELEGDDCSLAGYYIGDSSIRIEKTSGNIAVSDIPVNFSYYTPVT